jgi:hypothetical protein
MEILLAEAPVDGYPVVIASGPITEDSLVALGEFVRESCERTQVNGAIVDCKRIEGALSAESLYRATPAFSAAVGQSLKVAYINPPASWRPEDDQFSRDIAYNRGGLLELFETSEEAAHWLQLD